MKIFIATDFKVVKDKGRILAKEKHSTILKRYFDAFGEIVLCTRFVEPEENMDAYEDITNIICSTIEVTSLYKLLLNGKNKELYQKMHGCNLAILRCPSIAANKAFNIAKKENKPCLVESMGCAWDAYWNHGVLGKIIAPYMYYKMRQVVKNSDYAIYVTREFLQHRYPRKGSSIDVSNVLISDLAPSIMVKRTEHIEKMDGKKVTLMTTGAVDVSYKGQRYVIEAIPKINKAGIKVKYLVVGEGNQEGLIEISKRLGVENQVLFTGRLSLNEVFELLDETDIYIQPSLQEGLPRSVIEAMSRGCICLGAKTAGIPELLDSQYVVRRKSSSDIANAVISLSGQSKDVLKANSLRNFDMAGNYESTLLDERRSQYFALIRNEISVFGD